MKFFVVALSLFAVAAAAPTRLDAAAEARRKLPALEHDEIHDEFGQFALRYVTAEGTVVSERGRLVPIPEGSVVSERGQLVSTPEGTAYYDMIIEGEVSYIGDDGQTYVTKYTANPDGYNADVNHYKSL